MTLSELGIPRTLEDTADPARAALVVYDMQAGILSQLPHGPEVLARVLDVLSFARERGHPVFFLRHMSLPAKLAGVFQRRQAMHWQRLERQEDIRPWFLRDSPGFALADELGPREDEAIFDKISMSAFEGTPLAMALRDLGLTSFMLCGIATEIGLAPTVRHGSDLGFIPIVIEDACGHGHAEAGERALQNMRFLGDAIMTTTNELRTAFAS
ncbi:Isochorismatase family protein YecD [Defluviimonas aquaemixtae]|uniref:Isochorismatase family protein YecD n=1 Tax=Albidovulum aquaemixtae TaxID=1542388 RepID=A0A2R8B5F6_9RHOB|nr:isochorismatase family cysteine hydrolase [Defluviimonas aquaemixtae]SPH17881.1 Isochorismatase family protein YecD [Defluviimonas aquaemixtae]